MYKIQLFLIHIIRTLLIPTFELKNYFFILSLMAYDIKINLLPEHFLKIGLFLAVLKQLINSLCNRAPNFRN